MEFDGQFIGSNTPINFDGSIADTAWAYDTTVLPAKYRMQYVRIPPKYLTAPTYETALPTDEDWDDTLGSASKQPKWRWKWLGDINNRFGISYQTPRAFFNSENWDGMSSTYADPFGNTWNFHGMYEATSRGTVKFSGGSLSINSMHRGDNNNTRIIKIVIKPDWDNLPYLYNTSTYNKFFTAYDCVGADPDGPRRINGNNILIGEGGQRTGTYNASTGWRYKLHRRNYYTSNEFSYGGWYGNWWYDYNDPPYGTGSGYKDGYHPGTGERFLTITVKERNGHDAESKRVNTHIIEHNTLTEDRFYDHTVGGWSQDGRTTLVQEYIRLNFGGSNYSPHGNQMLENEFWGEIAQITVWEVPTATDMFTYNSTQAGTNTISTLHGRYQQCRLMEEKIRNGTQA